MTITSTMLTRASGIAAAAAGLIFIAVQVNHPHLDASVVTTAEWTIRNAAKAAMSALALAGITGMYLRHVRQIGLLGLIGYVLFAAGYLVMFGIEIVATAVLPALADTASGWVNDVLAIASSGTPVGAVGPLETVIKAEGVLYLTGGLVFGIALFRSRVLARWAAALLSAGTFATIAIPLLPQVNERLFALPTGVALIGLGYSLWRGQRHPAPVVPVLRTPELDSAGAA